VIRAAVVLLFLGLFIPPATVVGVVLTLLTGNPRSLYVLARVCVNVGLFLAGVRLKVTGLEHMGEARNTVFMANHLSLLDPPLLLKAIPVDFKVLVKQELFKTPFLGTAMLRAGLIPVDRKNREQARRAISQAVESLRRGNDFVVFPEGTRSRTGELGEFKKGVFLAAMEAGSRIVPVVVGGTGTLLPKGRFALRPGTVTVDLLPPLPATPTSDRDRLMDEVRGRIAAAQGR
jgi:1-acyl-sn-glycerol-3-phosphate acyltransferase